MSPKTVKWKYAVVVDDAIRVSNEPLGGFFSDCDFYENVTVIIYDNRIELEGEKLVYDFTLDTLWLEDMERKPLEITGKKNRTFQDWIKGNKREYVSWNYLSHKVHTRVISSKYTISWQKEQ